MTLRIDSSDDGLQEDFCNFLIECIQTDIQEQTYNRKNKLLCSQFDKLNEFLNSSQSGYQKRFYGIKQLDVREIIIQGLYNLIYQKHGRNYIITIDQNATIPGTFIPIKNACKLINYGNLLISGTRIFNKEFDKIEHNIEDYIKLYKEE